MKKVKESVQDLYQDIVVIEFYMSLKAGDSVKKAFKDAVIYAIGIADGGSYLGYEYDFTKCIKVLSNVMMSRRRTDDKL